MILPSYFLSSTFRHLRMFFKRGNWRRTLLSWLVPFLRLSRFLSCTWKHFWRKDKTTLEAGGKKIGKRRKPSGYKSRVLKLKLRPPKYPPLFVFQRLLYTTRLYNVTTWYIFSYGIHGAKGCQVWIMKVTGSELMRKKLETCPLCLKLQRASCRNQR